MPEPSGAAVISDCGRYRYSLTRRWEADARPVLFCMLNPSTTNASVDDPTIRRCIGFAKTWGHGALEVVNLFALLATDPRELYKAGQEAVGTDNDWHIREAAIRCFPVVVAWGAHGSFLSRGGDVVELLRLSGALPLCLGVTKDGLPRHPLYVRGDQQPYLFTKE